MITAVVPTSPIPSHPETGVIEETLNSIRHHLPDAEIILTFDGIRPEQEHLRADYDEYTRRALWLADHHYGNVCPLVADEHQHQTGMMRAALQEIRTDLLLYVEHDTPLVVDEPIDFAGIFHFVTAGKSNVVRLHHEAVIPEAHEHLVHGLVEQHINNGRPPTRFLRTSQWSQRPHIAAVAYYRRVMESYFTPDARSFIEDRMHGVVDEAFKVDGISGWNQHRLHIYAPPVNMKRSYHLDGRAGAEKFDDSQVF